MNEGIVKWYDNSKGWGFVTADLYRDAFLHRSEMCPTIAKYIKQGDKVTFDLYLDPKDHTRYIAKNLKLNK